MKQQKAIPIAFNMSLGLIPLILGMILIEFIDPRIALSGSAIISGAYSFCSYYRSGKRIYNFIAYIGTGVLLLISTFVFLWPTLLTVDFLTFTMATSMLVCTGSFFYGQSISKKLLSKVKDPTRADLIEKSLNSSIVSARLIFLVGLIHFGLILLFMVFSNPSSGGKPYLLYHLIPIIFLIIVIAINQLVINLASRFTKNEVEIPIVNESGDVIGKRFKMEIPAYKNAYINPVIRVAFMHKGMLFLVPRTADMMIDTTKVDLPLETYLEFGETLPAGLDRIFAKVYPNDKSIQPRFSLKHRVKSTEADRLVYLYIAYIENEELLGTPHFTGGKLWTFQQIEMNLGKNFFSNSFEAEYEYLKETVRIWEEYFTYK